MKVRNYFLKAVFVVAGITLASAPLFADNPIISHRYTADPNAMVYNGRVYVFCSNDDDNNGSYGLSSYILVSSDDMANWTDHGEVFRVPRDASWASRAFAPTCIEKDGKFYLYFPNSGNNIGVAVADRPEGPYKDALGKALITKSMPNCDVEWCFDPAIFIDDDGTPYLYFGGGQNSTGRNLRGIELNKDMISVKGTAQTIQASNSFEASFMHKYNGKYYFSYATAGKSNIDYMISDNPLSGFDHKGTILPNPAINGQNINAGNNNHASIIEFEGKWYMFYHDRRISKGDTYKRNASVDLLTYGSDGTIKTLIVTQESVPQIKMLNPFDTVQCETMDEQSGIETDVCSEGGMMLTNISDGDYTSLSGVDFKAGANGFEIRASSKSGGGTVELHRGSKTGDKVGTCEITATGSWDTWKTFQCEIKECTGTDDLYLVYKGSGEPFRLNWFLFTSLATNSIPAKGSSNYRIGSKEKLSITVQDNNKSAYINSPLLTLSGRTVQKNIRRTTYGMSNGAYVIGTEK